MRQSARDQVEADRLFAAERAADRALEHYWQLLKLVGDHQPAATDLRRAVAEATSAKDRITDQLQRRCA